MKEKYISKRLSSNKEIIYQVQVPIYVTGKRKYRSHVFSSLQEAIDYRDNVMQEYNMIPVSVMATIKKKKQEVSLAQKPIKDILPKWYLTYKRPKLGARACEWYDDIYANKILPVFGEYKTADVTRDMVQEFANSLRLRGNSKRPGEQLAAATVRRIIGLFKTFLDYVIDGSNMVKNPAKNIQVIPSLLRKKKMFSVKNQEKLLKCLLQQKEQIWYVLYRMYFETLCRRGELAGLKWKNVDLVGKTIYIKETLTVVNAEAVLKPYPKNPQSIGYIHISDDIVRLLRKLYFKQKMIDPRTDKESFVFRRVQKGEKYIFPEKISSNFRYYCRKCGLYGYTLHGTRKTGASRLLNAGVPITQVQAIGRWKKPTVLLEHYAEAEKGQTNKAMELYLFN